MFTRFYAGHEIQALLLPFLCGSSVPSVFNIGAQLLLPTVRACRAAVRQAMPPFTGTTCPVM
jgi:hypothetical protein